MRGYEKTDFEVLKNKEDICPKNNIAEIYFKIDRSNLNFSFDSMSGDASDNHRFANRK